MKKLAYYLLMIPLFGIGMTSCSEDNNGLNTPETPQEESVYVEDELAVLQKHLVRVDDEGNLVERIWGEVLDAATPDEVTIGVDNLAEAVAIFRGFFADTTEISEDGMLATFSVQEGSAELKGANGENGLVACATFDVPGLKHISRINFILNSAWPENATATGFHKFGVFYEYKGFIDHDKFDGFEKYIERFEFVLGASKSLPMGVTAVSYNDTLVMTASLACLEKNLLKKVIDQFVKDDITCTIEMNDLEVEDEEMFKL